MNYNISLIPGRRNRSGNRCRSKKSIWTKYVKKYGHTFSYSEVLLMAERSIDVTWSAAYRRGNR